VKGAATIARLAWSAGGGFLRGFLGLRTPADDADLRRRDSDRDASADADRHQPFTPAAARAALVARSAGRGTCC
jgi:hypothetical protein